MKKGAATVLGLGAALSMTGQSYPPREQEKYIASSKEKRWKRWRNRKNKIARLSRRKNRRRS